jgi:hypothetical protein
MLRYLMALVGPHVEIKTELLRFGGRSFVEVSAYGMRGTSYRCLHRQLFAAEALANRECAVDFAENLATAQLAA